MDGAQAAAVPAAQAVANQPPMDDWEARFHHHKAKVKSLEPKAEAAEAAAKSARKDVNNAVEIGATELGVTNELFKRWLKMSGVPIEDITHERSLEEKALRTMGKLVQPDLFAKNQDTAGLQAIWHFRGYDDGINGADQREGIDPIYLQDYMRGRTSGMAVLTFGLARGEQLEKEKGQPSTAEPIDLSKDGEDEEDEEDKIADAADKLRRDPEFMARGGGEGDDEAPAGDEAKKPAAKGPGKGQVH